MIATKPIKLPLAFSVMLIFFSLMHLRATAALPKIYAVVVGITTYQESSLDLNYADKDAEAFAGFLKSPNCGNTPADQVALLVNQDATRANVLGAVRRFSEFANSNDVFILYYAGHATNNTLNNNLFLMTYDTDPKNIFSTATSAGDIKSLLDGSLAKMTFWITDACNSGKIEPGKIIRGPKEQPSGADGFLKAIAATHSGGFVYLASSQSQETTQEGTQYGGGHGIFTYYLLEGLKGKADDNHDGIITINEAYDYVRLKVIKSSENSQHPVLGDLYFNGKFPVACTRNFDNLKAARNRFSTTAKPPKPIKETSPLEPVTPPAAEENAPSFEQTVKVNSLTNTHIRVFKGDKVLISATGSINVSPIVGSSGPEGRDNKRSILSVQRRNIVPGFRHAVLMFKLKDTGQWVECGASFNFNAAENGELIFQVNDLDQSNNKGEYVVTVRKY